MIHIEHYNESSFTFETWSAGNLIEMLNIHNRTDIILENSDVIRKFAIGWCHSDNIVCRPKSGKISVMFFTNGHEWWTHFEMEEFIGCFPELKDDI